MGAWGEEVFENDSAEEWGEQLTSQNGTAFVLRPLRSIAKTRVGLVLEADSCACALAAAEVIAAAQGYPCRGLPEEINEWLAKKVFVPGTEEVQLARDAVARIASGSELKELWDDDRAWSTGLKKLLERLERTPKPRKPSTRKSATKMSDVGTVKLSEIRKIAKQRKGGLAVINGEPNYLGFDGAILKDLMAVGNCPDCQRLKSLEIGGRGITDRGMESIGRLTGLRELDLDAPSVTDAGMSNLASMTGLETLLIRRSQVTDVGLEHLAQLRSLKSLHVHKSAVTPRGLTQLARQLGCKVFSDVLK